MDVSAVNVYIRINIPTLTGVECVPQSRIPLLSEVVRTRERYCRHPARGIDRSTLCRKTLNLVKAIVQADSSSMARSGDDSPHLTPSDPRKFIELRHRQTGYRSHRNCSKPSCRMMKILIPAQSKRTVKCPMIQMSARYLPGIAVTKMAIHNVTTDGSVFGKPLMRNQGNSLRLRLLGILVVSSS